MTSGRVKGSVSDKKELYDNFLEKARKLLERCAGEHLCSRKESHDCINCPVREQCNEYWNSRACFYSEGNAYGRAEMRENCEEIMDKLTKIIEKKHRILLKKSRISSSPTH